MIFSEFDTGKGMEITMDPQLVKANGTLITYDSL